ncbi:shikimate kinase [Mariniblastus fucicola]|uniref:Shikimate kinase n=1 Tax=Mariniblastus fucicola TaxID=980251 RepID=A0A5B9PPS3_9BACT|nr:shikimate kinase [Mariniblastus fucicola]QEG24283.1 Shikimate kinase [Mariniblastus fucicola]
MNLYLIGYRGSGKSTVARILSELLGWAVVDSDDEIEILAGKTISQIFESEQEKGFRKWESTVIEGLAMLDQTVIALGGGAVLAESNRKRIAESGKAVWLQVSAETSHARITIDENSATQRPNLTQTGGIDEIEQMLAVRSPIYQTCADLVVDADSKTPSEIAAEIFDHFEALLLGL